MTGENRASGSGMLEGIRGWQGKATEKSFLAVKEAFRIFIFAMQADLSEEDKKYRNALSQEDSEHRNNLSDIENRYLINPNNSAEKECNRILNKLATEWKGPDGEKTVTDNRIKSFAFSFSYSGVFGSISSALRSKQDDRAVEDFRTQYERVSNLAAQANEAYENTVSCAKKVRDAKIRLNSRIFEDAKREEITAHNNRQKRIETEYKNAKEAVYNRYNEEFSAVFNSETFNSAWANIQVFMKPENGYTYSKSIPKNLYLGKRTFSVKSDADFFPEVINMVKGIDFRGIETMSDEIRIELPFFRSIEEGYSVYLKVSDNATKHSDTCVRDYVWKILMNFCAGQTVPLLLDFDVTTALTDFREIGEASGNRMVTRPWADEADIEKELGKVAQEHTNLTTSYSDDTESRMEREPVYFVAARNFPRGFTKNAVKSLSKIFTAGSGKGFFGIVQVNGAELAAKEADGEWKTLTSAVKNTSLYVEEVGNGYVICDGNSRDDFEFEAVTDDPEILRDIKSSIITGVKNYSRQVEKFEYLFSKDAGNAERTDMHDFNTWYTGDATEKFEVPLGISGASNVQKLSVRSTAQHALISGITGSGKSSLLRTMIVAAMMKYPPEQVNFYLIDFKEGVEFEPFGRYKLPWIKAIALNTQRAFALEILKFIEDEFEKRAGVMSRHNVNEISKVPGEVYPRIILVFDEIQELLREDDSITEKCVSILAKLVSEGRAMNINIVIASQSFANCIGIKTIKTNMAIRIAFKGAPESAQLIMGEAFDCAQLEQGGPGFGAINEASGEKGRTNFFSGGFLSNEELAGLLATFEATMNKRETKTRIMSIYVDRDRDNKFNRFICNNEVTPNTDPSRYELMLGDEFLIDKKREYFISREKSENLAVIGKDEETAKSVFAFSVLSALYGELASRAVNIQNELVRFIDLSDEYDKDPDYFEFMGSLFRKQISRVGLDKSREMINDTYNVLSERKNGRADCSERLFFMIFGIDSIMYLNTDSVSTSGEPSLREKLITIVREGPEHGINSIIWSRELNKFRNIFSDGVVQEEFRKRIFFGENKADAEFLTGSGEEVSLLTEKTVLYRDIYKSTASAFRVFELPERSWVARIEEIYSKIYTD